MRDIAVVTDSTVDLPSEVLEELGIEVVPLDVIVGEKTYEDGTFSQEAYFEMMAASEKLPTTSLPPATRFIETYERVLSSARSVVEVSVSSKLSGTIEVARQAAQKFGDRVRVIDSLNVSGGLGLVAIAAARAARRAGATVESVVEAAKDARARTRVLLSLDGLENLAKGGRIGRVTKIAGSMLNIRPVIEVVDGALVPAGRVRGQAAQIRKLVDLVAQRRGERGGGTFVVLHAMAAGRARQLKEALIERFAPDEVMVQEAGTVVSTHTGSGVGVAFFV